MDFDNVLERLERMTHPMFCNISVQGKEDITALLYAYKEMRRAFGISIVRRREDQTFNNECEEFDYWLSEAHAKLT